jgi:hypothetical protein
MKLIVIVFQSVMKMKYAKFERALILETKSSCLKFCCWTKDLRVDLKEIEILKLLYMYI